MDFDLGNLTVSSWAPVRFVCMAVMLDVLEIIITLSVSPTGNSTQTRKEPVTHRQPWSKAIPYSRGAKPTDNWTEERDIMEHIYLLRNHILGIQIVIKYPLFIFT